MHYIFKATEGVDWESEEIPVQNASGKVFSVIWSSANLKNAEGDFIATIAQGQDITERKKAEEDLLKAYDTTISGWAHALELKDNETAGHSTRVVELTLRIAQELGIEGKTYVHSI